MSNVKTYRMIAASALMLAQAGCSVLGIRSEESPKYEVLVKSGDMEIRSYAPYVVAKTVVEPGQGDDPQREGFRRLAGYIFGSNERKQSIAMTAPVVSSESQKNLERDGQKIAMTAPVTEVEKDGGWVMTFMMPSRYALEDLPMPKDPRVSLEPVPAKIVGAIRFSGQRRNQDKLRQLSEWLAGQAGYEISGQPAFAGYDPPWTLPFLRRNEIHIGLKPKN
jgi:hypothetical protein